MSLHTGLDYLLYRIYVWGGLIAVVAWIVYVSINFEPRAAWFQTLLSLSLYVGGILGYWWWVFLFKDDDESPSESTDVQALSNLKSWTTLHQAMSLSGGDAEALKQNKKSAKTPMLVWYGAANLLVIWLFGFFWLGYFDVIPEQSFYLLPIGVVAIAVGMLAFTPLLVKRNLQASEIAYLAPLGLTVAQTPVLAINPAAGLFGGGQAVMPKGATLVTGQRHGRTVQIQLDGQHCLTWVQAGTPPFEIQSQNGKLTASANSPPNVVEGLKGLRTAKRWRGITVTGDEYGIVVERNSTGQNMWLYDLWLIERLLTITTEQT